MKKTYFASDFHLGINAQLTSAEREKKIVRWLNSIQNDAETIYLVGDIFDFWFEYKTVVPKGYVRLLGKLAELRDAGIQISFFTGNHDMWMFRYLEDEMGIPIHKQPILTEINGKKFFIGHGDGLGPGDHNYKLLKKIFANPLCQWLFARLHPNFGVGVATYWSHSSRAAQPTWEMEFLGEDHEWLIQYSNKKLLEQPNIDYFVFGHRHVPTDFLLKNDKSRYMNVGDWMFNYSYGVFDGVEMRIEFFERAAKPYTNDSPVTEC
jgi:UDP-2,3-diacylglucosamine hydrolase